jgi:cytochrome c553
VYNPAPLNNVTVADRKHMVQTMKAGLRWVAACALAGGLMPVLAATPSSTPSSPFDTGSAQRGAAKAAACSACHGPNGNSADPQYPRLAGQSAVYLARQLEFFKKGLRDNAVMKPMAAGLSDADIADLAVYFQAQTPVGLEADSSTVKAGEALYRSGDKSREIPACIACHGPVGRGNVVGGYPALQAQHAVYVAKQLNDYKTGARYTGSHPENTVPNAVMMITISQRLTPTDVGAVASYVQGLR